MNRNTLTLLGILAVLAIVTFFLMQRPGEQSRESSGGKTLLALDSASVDRIEIRSPKDSITLVRQGPDWMIDQPIQYKANQQNAKAFVGLLTRAQVKTLVSSNSSKQSLFQVDSSGTWVTISEKGKSVGTLIVGKMGPSYADAYVRVKGTNDVILTDAGLSYSSRRAVKEWRDKDITNIPKEEIKEVKYQYGDTTFTATWRDSVWMIGTQTVNSGVMNPILASLSNFQTDDFLDAAPVPAPRMVATISYANLQLQFSQMKGSDKYVVRSSSSPQWFEVQGWRANQVLKRKKALVSTPS
jgi:Domain of unknown function (DUF4340)